MIAEGAFYRLDAPVRRLGALDVPDAVLADARGRDRADAGAGRGDGARRFAARLREGATRWEFASYGVMGVDWEERANFDRLRTERLARAKAGLERSELGALLCFDMSNIRYITATHIGMWAVDKYVRFCLLPQADEPIMWDFGSAARHHKLYNPWLGEDRSRAGISTLRGSVKGRAEAVAEKIRVELEQRGLLERAARRRHRRAAGSSCARGGGHHRRRRPGVDAGRPQDQDDGRDHAC